MALSDLIAVGCLVWYSAVVLVCSIGILQIRRNTVKKAPPPISNTFPLNQVPHVTIIRPVKGIEPYLYECLAATFHQTYPLERLTIFFCIASRRDPALPVLDRLLSDFPAFDVKILVEEEDPNLSGRDGKPTNLGPNPKIRNMSRAYREAKGDIIWIIDCNVWVSPSVAARMVDLLCGLTAGAETRTPESKPAPLKYKFVHQLPLVVDVSNSPEPPTTTTTPLSSGPPASPSTKLSPLRLPLSQSGGLLEELFLSTSHAKFYTAIATVAIAPCTVGKSNMFRRSHLNALTTTPSASPSAESSTELRGPGIDFFSDNICEDHLISDLLWRSLVPASVRDMAENEGQPSPTTPSTGSPPPPQCKWSNHGLLPPHPSLLATQPTSHLPLLSYIDRRTRWLRVRKFTVTAATLVEPGTESLLCSLYGAWGLTSSSVAERYLRVPQTWGIFWVVVAGSVVGWMGVDWYVWNLLQHGHHHISSDKFNTTTRPLFGRKPGQRRPFTQWLLAWLGRELLAFPIWCWAVVGGGTVVWRGRKFWVRTDMKVHEIEGEGEGEKGKRRRD